MNYALGKIRSGKKLTFRLTSVVTAAVIGLGIFGVSIDTADIHKLYAASKTQNASKGQSGKSQKNSADNAKQPASKKAVWKADLTHDGKMETISFDTKQLQRTGLADFIVMSADGDDIVLFSKTISTSHAGWSTFALYDDGDEQYLLEYNPYFGQGSGSYSFRLFSLSGSGEIRVKEEGNVNFSAGMPYGAPDNDVDAIVRFTDIVNDYWSKSALLVTTDQFTVMPNLYNADGNRAAVEEEENYFVGKNTQNEPLHYVERMGWTDIVLNGKKSAAKTSLRTRLKAVNRVFAKQRKSLKNIKK